MQERKQLTSLFQKYQDGLVNEEEKTRIARWLIQLEVLGEQLTPLELQAKADLSKSELSVLFFPKEIQKPKTVKFPFWIRSVAACLFIGLALGGFYYAKHQAPVPSSLVFTATQAGEMKIVTLSDGSKITLNSQSRLTYPTTFNGKTRDVYLTGEAFFNIVHSPKQPFKVHADKLDVQVLGTSFNVSAYPADKQISVAVATGKVGVMSKIGKKTTYMLLPGDQLSYHRTMNSFRSSRLTVADIGSWSAGKFVFKNQPLEDITNQLQRHYNVKFIFRSKMLLAKQLSLRTNNQDIATLMKALSLSGNFNYQIKGQQIIIW